MFTTENTEDTEFLNKEITQAVIASAICIRKNLWPGQLESVLKLTGMKTDLLINFNVPLHKDGLKCISF